jgi:DNA-binding NarL/FixJ family response regulator
LALLADLNERGYGLPYVPPFLLGLAIVAADEGQTARAARLAASSAALRGPQRIQPFPHSRAALARISETARLALGDDDFAAVCGAGSTLSVAQAVAEALTDAALSPTAAPARDAAQRRRGEGCPLTPRELDVLRLIVDGRHDKEIADSLFLSRRTVTSHVTSILGKLHLPSRAAAAEAVRRGLV